MKKAFLVTCYWLIFGLCVHVGANPFLRDKDKKRLNKETIALFETAQELTQPASVSTVGIYFRNQRICYGAVVAEGFVATKLSEVEPLRNHLVLLDYAGTVAKGRIIVRKPEHDLAIIKTSEKFVSFESQQPSELIAGDLVFAARPDNIVMSGGVVSVLPRSLRTEDQGFLGVSGRNNKNSGIEGFIVSSVEPNSAADFVGIRVGDSIRKIDDKEIDAFKELSVLLKRKRPGDSVEIEIIRNGQIFKKTAVLHALDERYGKRMPTNGRFQKMESMGAELSQRREGFAKVIQTDLDLRAVDMGAPVVNLDGKVLGIAIARASRIKCYVLPIDVIQQAMKTLR